MKAVGIKVLKDKLSNYLNLVRKGETVLVTDRDEVIAEIRKPARRLTPGADSVESILNELAGRGLLLRARHAGHGKEAAAAIELPPRRVDLDLQALLDDLRGDRW